MQPGQKDSLLSRAAAHIHPVKKQGDYAGGPLAQSPFPSPTSSATRNRISTPSQAFQRHHPHFHKRELIFFFFMVLRIKPRASQVLSKHSTEPPPTHPGHPKGSGLEAELSGTRVLSKAQMQGPDSSKLMKALTGTAQLHSPLSPSGRGRARHARTARATTRTYTELKR